MPAILVRGSREVPVLTGDVSYRGLFLRTDDPPPLRELLQLRLKLPPANDGLVIHAMAVFVMPPGKSGSTPGVGLQLYAVGTEVRSRWDRFVHWVATTHPDSLETPVKSVAAAPDPVSRLFPRVRRALTVRTRFTGDLHDLVPEDVSRGGMFLPTGFDAAIGSALRLVVAHPQTGQTFGVDTVVRRRVEPPHPRAGIGVEFVGLDQERRKEFAAFAGLDEMLAGEDAVYVATDDPFLA